MFSWLVLIGLFLYIYQPLVLWDMRGEFPLTLVYVQCLTAIWLFSWLFDPNKRLFVSITVPALLVYTLSITLSALFSNYVNITDYHARSWLGHMLLFVIFITSAKTNKDLKIVLTCFLVLFFAFMAQSYWDFRSAGLVLTENMYTGRLYGIRNYDPNYLATGIVCTLPFLVPLVTLCKRYWHYLFVLGYVLLALQLVVLSGSRGGIIALVALAILPVLFSRYRFRVLPVILLVLPLGWVFMGEMYQTRFRTIWDPGAVRNSGAEEAMQGRIVGFHRGIELWWNNPVFGVGLGGQAAMRAGYLSAHNLPGQLAGELGTFGIITFLIFLSCFGINHYNIWKNYKYLQEKKLGKEGLFNWRVSLAVMYSVVLLLLQGIGLNNASEYFWIWFAAFQVLAAIFMQEKVTAVMQGRLLPSLPLKK